MFENFDSFFGGSERKKGNTKKDRRFSESDFFTPEQPLEVTGPLLERMMARVSDRPEEDRYPLLLPLYHQLMGSMVITPIPTGSAMSKDETLAQGLSLMVIQNESGERGIPIFTSEEAMSFWVNEPTEYVGLPFTVLCTYAVESELDFLVINAAGPAGGEISHYEMTYLAERLAPPPQTERSGELTLEKDTEIHLAPLASPSVMLTERISGVCSQKTQLVNRVYAFQVAFSEGPLKTALGIRMPEGSEDRWETELWPDILAVLQEVLGAKEYVNVFLLNQAGDLEDTLQEITEPLYVAKSA